MRGLVLIGVVAAGACTMDNPQFSLEHGSTTGASDGVTTDVVTTTGPATTDLPSTSTGTASDPTTDPTTDPTLTGGTDTGVTPICGDGVLQPEVGELCDDGVNNGLYGYCNAMCTATLSCGDGFTTPPEACDDGNNVPGDGCGAGCVLESCGDKMLDPKEECDDGNPLDTDACTNNCLMAKCGDAVIYAGVEQCDDANLDNTDDCLDSCLLAVCGDGQVQAGIEQCDDGNDSNNDACSNSCKLSLCGDGFIQPGEECDDANAVDADSCLGTCKLATCGDGFIKENFEQCDLGLGMNKDNGQCTSKCQYAKCGDGFVHIGTEQCDDANMVETDVCTKTCTLNYCLRVENSNAENLVGGNLLDACVAQQLMGKKNVAISLIQSKNLVYSSWGQIVQTWSLPNITSSKSGDLQYDVAYHDNLISLKNGDKLMITGHKAEAGGGCWQAMGDGYGIVVYPAMPDPIKNPKLMVMSYKGGATGTPRMFPSWNAAREISWAGGQGMAVCDPAGPVAATEHIFFLHVF